MTKTITTTKKGVQTVKIVLKLDQGSTNRTVSLKGKERSYEELTKIVRRKYSSIINMGGDVIIVENVYSN